MKQLPTIDFNMRLSADEQYHFTTAGEVVEAAMDMLQQHCHAASYNRGWWADPITGKSLIPDDFTPYNGPSKDVVWLEDHDEKLRKAFFPYVVATKIVLIHSEASEMLESHRTGKRDDKINFPGVAAEGADVIIRVMDLLGMMDQHRAYAGYPEFSEIDFNVGAALLAKLPFNGARLDHSLEARKAPDGKKY